MKLPAKLNIYAKIFLRFCTKIFLNLQFTMKKKSFKRFIKVKKIFFFNFKKKKLLSVYITSLCF